MKKNSKKKKNEAELRGLKSAGELASHRAFRTQMYTHIFAVSFLVVGFSLTMLGGAAAFYSFSKIGVTETLRLQGRLQAIEQSTPVQHDTGGVVKNVFVTDGEVVREGQILMSLGTEDIEQEHEKARQEVARLLIQTHCLRALRDENDSLVLPNKLETAAARLQQVEFLRRAKRECQVELEKRQLLRLKETGELAHLSDLADMATRLAAAKDDIRLRVKIVEETTEFQETPISEILELDHLTEVLQSSLNAASAQQNLERKQFKLRQESATRVASINRQLDILSDKLIDAEADLSRMEKLMQRRFVFASTSGRVQRLRVNEAGKRIAASAYILEIAPLTTDFEVISTVNSIDIPDLDVGTGVQVKLSGGMPKPIWVPAVIENITKATANKRLVRIVLKREDLNKRDLLLGDHSLNGLGEQSEAIISITPESAFTALQTILKRQWIGAKTTEI